MSKDKVSTQELAELLSDKVSISKKAAEEFIKQLFMTIEDNLLSGEQVKVKNLGTFKLQWNEPRKSINVQTGEEIILAGYKKISFTPDAGLKELVNEPYAHLEPVVLDNSNEPTMTDVADNLPDPLRTFNEQANEIKDILSEIKSLSAQQNFLSEKVEKEEIKEVEIILTDTEIENNEELLSEDDEMVAEAENILLQDEDEYENKDAIVAQQPFDSQTEGNAEESIIDTETSELTEAVEIVEIVANTIDIEKEEEEEEEEITEEEVIEAEETIEVEEAIEAEEAIEIEVIENVAEEVVEKIEPETEPNIPSATDIIETTVSKASIQGPPNTEPPVQKKSKRKPFFKSVWVWLFIVIITILGSTIAVYYSSTCVSCWFEYKVLNQEQRTKLQKATHSIESYITDFKAIFKGSPDATLPAPTTTQELPADTLLQEVTPVEPTSPIDSLDILLNKPRVYTEFIGSERIMEGSRLARISERYYGTRDFWIYIYEANKERIDNPDMIPIGTMIKIPKVDARLLNAQNPKVMLKARELHDLYVGKK